MTIAILRVTMEGIGSQTFPFGPMHVLTDTAQLKIAFRPGDGSSDNAFVAFAGVQGAFGGIPVEEFAGSLGKLGSMRDAYFVIDKTRSWYNDTVEDIVAVLAPRLAGQRVVTLGNSMGGFGALLFGERFEGCESVVAFCPQYSVDRTLVPFESRWSDHVGAITEFRHPACLSQAAAGRVRFVFAGDGHAGDVAHARLIQARMAPGDGVFVLRNCRHDVAQVLKQRGLLTGVLAAALAAGADCDAVAACLEDGGVGYELWRGAASQGSSEASKSG